ncbi:MAG: hypothetical protein ACRYG5_17655 [Janthinobacterium lividum]
MSARSTQLYHTPSLAARLNSRLTSQIYRFTHSSHYRHNERFWPHTRIVRDGNGRIKQFSIGDRQIPLVNGTLAGGSEGGACHLIAAGPSIKRIDYSALPIKTAFGVNGAIALAGQFEIPFRYYCIFDTGFIRGRPELVAEVLQRDLVLFTTPLCLWHLLRTFPREQLACRFFLVEDLRFKAGYPARTIAQALREDGSQGLSVHDANPELGFSADIGKGLFDGGTVAYLALQAAVWLGFESIYLHGIDITNASQTPRFYETSGQTLGTTLEEYFPIRIKPSFELASRICAARGVSVRNLSPDSALGNEIFPKIDWRTLCEPATQTLVGAGEQD